jgi:hypothetical protein
LGLLGLIDVLSKLLSSGYSRVDRRIACLTIGIMRSASRLCRCWRWLSRCAARVCCSVQAMWLANAEVQTCGGMTSETASISAMLG